RERMGNALVSYAAYIRKAFWPSDLAVFYPRSGSHNLMGLLVAAGLLACITMIAVWFGRRHPYLPAGWLWYLGTLVPVIGLVQVGEQAMADRYTYIPMVGLSIMVVWAAADLSRKLKIRRWVLTCAAVAAACGMGVLTWIQTGYWTNSRTLFQRAIQATGENELAYFNYGASLVAFGDLDSAAALYRVFLARNRGVADIHANLGLIAALQNDKAEAVQQFQTALNLEPGHPEAHNGMGVELAALGRPQGAREHYLAALEHKREFPEALYNLGNLSYAEGNPELAMEQFRAALKLRPLYPEANERLALIMAGMGRLEAALPFYETAVRAQPENPHYHYHFGMALIR
ncbi:MAG: tetratricopeptide repeat protein, partial [Syntrophales bacterium LBB04]|nr:tetratricopeptide repeat protein [Syntrophales bacterium LBB04]